MAFSMDDFWSMQFPQYATPPPGQTNSMLTAEQAELLGVDPVTGLPLPPPMPAPEYLPPPREERIPPEMTPGLGTTYTQGRTTYGSPMQRAALPSQITGDRYGQFTQNWMGEQQDPTDALLNQSVGTPSSRKQIGSGYGTDMNSLAKGMSGPTAAERMLARNPRFKRPVERMSWLRGLRNSKGYGGYS